MLAAILAGSRFLGDANLRWAVNLRCRSLPSSSPPSARAFVIGGFASSPDTQTLAWTERFAVGAFA